MFRYPVKDRQHGFSLLEALVALVVLSVGALGVIGLVVSAQQSNEQALQRGRATLLVNDMLERIRANATSEALAVYAVGEGASAPIGGGQQAGGIDCRGRWEPCSSIEMARSDLEDWERQISPANNDGLPDARACISSDGATPVSQVTVSLVWQGTGPGAASNNCGSSDIANARQGVAISSRFFVEEETS
ncbi:type IV pilus modification protein PilV [Kushneria aurantia]|uniref:Type IV pilus modification protein PilV n=1 Tax=Kushneria aurantia TaxID=504092 RepID=A0ABV6FYQ4_9GAMM|nr:type IV pilus modification protein PilV [Kushneria aurantia]